MPRHCFPSEAVFSSLSLFLWTLSECRFSRLRQLEGRPGQGGQGSARVGLPHCAAIRSAGPASPGACGRARPVPSPASLRLGLRGHVRAEGWNSELWLLALLFRFFFFFKSLGLLRSAGLGASLSDWGWRQTETATRADWGGRRKSAGMLSQGPRTPASGCYYLNAMTPEGQEMYLRFDQTTRRSPYRMSRILARHQLVTKIQQGESLVAEGCC